MRNTFAVKPSISSCKCLLRIDVCRRGKGNRVQQPDMLIVEVYRPIFPYSYVQSVEKVVPRLLVLQEQLKVFEDLTQNQQTLL